MQLTNIQTKSSYKRGFTLVELIVVISIIATLLTIGVGTIKNVAGSKGVGTGVSIAEGVFEHARSLAKARGKARVVIYADTGGDAKDKRERFLRGMAVQAIEAKDNPSDTDVWQFTNAGENLPQNTFFNANLCPGVASTSFDFPGVSGQQTCYYYEFNSEGALVNPAGGGQFVIQAGKLLPGQDLPKKSSKAKRDVGGFKIWKTGKTSIFRSPNQIEEVTSGDLEF